VANKERSSTVRSGKV